MSPLIIEPGDSSPKVVLDPTNNIFELSGESHFENTSKFYIPILTWLDQYQSALHQEKDKSRQEDLRMFEFKLNYFNSTSAKFIMDILMRLDKIAGDGWNVKARWYYDKRDEDMKESGEGFSMLLKKLPIEFIGF